MATLTPDLELTRAEDREVREVLVRSERLNRVRARREMAAAAKLQGERGFVRGPDGAAGYVQSQIPPAVWHYWGQRLGYQCWRDKRFMQEFLRDNPACRVRSRPQNATVIVDASFNPPSKRFVKRYPHPIAA